MTCLPSAIDVCILGGGPAGLASALWLRNFGLMAAIFDRLPVLGGMQRLNFLANDWVLGIPGLTGPQLADRYVEHVRDLDIPVVTSAQLASVCRDGGNFAFGFTASNGEAVAVAARALIVATGTRSRGSETLAHVAGIGDLPQDRVIFGPYAFANMDALTGQRVLIVGGGDNAFENAKRLIGRAARITLAIRSRPRAQTAMVATIRHCAEGGLCEMLEEARVVAVRREADGLHVACTAAGRPCTVVCDRIHVLAGYEPNSGFLAPLLKAGGLPAVQLNADGYILVDEEMHTSCPGIYAAGDVCNPKFPSVAAAISGGAIAAKAILSDLSQ